MFIKKSVWLLALTSLLVGCVGIPLGDGNKLEVSDDGINVTGEEGEEYSLSINEESDQIEVTGSGNDGEDMTLTMGDNIEIPETFPVDIPLPEEANIFQAVDIDESISVAFEIAVDIQEIDTLYKEHINSDIYSDLVSNASQAGSDSHLQYSAERQEGRLNISIMNSQQVEGGTRVVLLFIKNTEMQK